MSDIARLLTFRVSLVSTLALFAASMAVTLGVHYGAVYGWIPVKILFTTFSFDTAFFIFSLLRGVLIFLLAFALFDEHIMKRPSLIWVLLGASFVGTVVPWLAIGILTKGLFVSILLSHLMALGILFLLWEPMVTTAKEMASK